MEGSISRLHYCMKIHVQNDTVRQNIELFKKLIARRSQKAATTSIKEQIYTAFINRTTGAMHFPELDVDEPPGSGETFLNSKIWKAIEIRIKKHEKEEGIFEVAEEETNWRCFRCDDMEPPAYKVLVETMNTLNLVSKKFQAQLQMGKMVRELTALEIESIAAVLSGKDIIHEAWHQVDRIEAEKLLSDQIEGTFLFRKDSYAYVLEEQLKEQYQINIKCVTLTFLEEEGKVTDKTLVAKDGNWLIYDDDPNLSGPSYPTIYGLLEKIKHILKAPLLN